MKSDFVKDLESMAENEYIDNIRTGSLFNTPNKTGFYVIVLRSFDEALNEDHTVIKRSPYRFGFGPSYWSEKYKEFRMSENVWWSTENDEIYGCSVPSKSGDTSFGIHPNEEGCDVWEEEHSEIGERDEAGEIIYYPFVKTTLQIIAMYQIDEFTFTGEPVRVSNEFKADVFGQLLDDAPEDTKR